MQKKYKKEVIPAMMRKFNYKNSLAVPRLEKVVVNIGTGSVKDDGQKERIEKHLSVITGQKGSKRPAKKSIASFKIRQGSAIGYSVTLRARRMYDFLSRLIFVAIPRKRDFRGLDIKSIDKSGNLTIGFKDHLVFPEMIGEDIKNVFGFSVTVVTTAKNKEEAIEFLKMVGFPFKKHG